MPPQRHILLCPTYIQWYLLDLQVIRAVDFKRLSLFQKSVPIYCILLHLETESLKILTGQYVVIQLKMASLVYNGKSYVCG